MSPSIRAAIVAMILALIPGHAAAARAVPPCRPDRSPGIVTRWEYDHARHGETRQQVACLYGTRGHAAHGFWGEDGRWHLAVVYPTAWGETDATFVDGRNDGHGYKLVRKFI